MPASPSRPRRRSGFFLLLLLAGMSAPIAAMQAEAYPATTAAPATGTPSEAAQAAQASTAPLAAPPPETDVRGRFDFAFDKLSAGLTDFIAWLPLLVVALAIVLLSTWLAGFISRRLHLLRLRTDNPYMNGLIRN